VVTRHTAFSPDYRSACERFRQAALHLGWQVETQPIGCLGPQGDELAFDVAISPGGEPTKVLVVSSGLHGVEGFFGSAVQISLLEHWARTTPPAVRCVFLHGLNPFGFAWLRRCDENNVDPNRNFLLLRDHCGKSPEDYARLDPFLNPRRPPTRWEPFTLKALLLIARYGMASLQHSVASGQYQFPQGLFYGGAGPSRTQQLLARHLPRWLAGSQCVVHLDFHSGLGPWGAGKLLIDYPLDERQRRCLTDWHGVGSFEASDSSAVAYHARGGFGRWCVSGGLAPFYLFSCAEFGTWSPLRVLAGLRAENQAHHWGNPSDPSTIHAKEALKELFCPADEEWRSQVVGRSLDLIGQSVRGLLELELPDTRLARTGQGHPPG